MKRQWNADDSDVTVENKAVTRVDIGTVCWRTRKHVRADPGYFPRNSMAVFETRRTGDQVFLSRDRATSIFLILSLRNAYIHKRQAIIRYRCTYNMKLYFFPFELRDN